MFYAVWLCIAYLETNQPSHIGCRFHLIILIKNGRAFSHETNVYKIQYIILMYIFHLHGIKWCVQKVGPCSDIKKHEIFQ